ncbi:RINT-1 family protein [Pseudovirgaria hyperparasitica]|uniref:RINT-1 family protein n=1 Tax=Pseudovirgaria hyperparasitica TaxID=470096 RepID=A0A6A6W9E7_9PEZI|nr:RINT-1 family protein [Pseudovirgaria hyperparasitica]KAF2758217.1 RINT-1 family protein [Pseudovirgaria hyperparasitica]
MAAAAADGDCAVRVADYVDDKLQTSADLATVDALLTDVRTRYGLLKSQLDHATRELEDAKKASRDHAIQLHRQSEQFNKVQDDITRRLQIVMQSETSDDAVPQFDAIFQKLQRLDVAAGYVGLLKEVDTLSQESDRLLDTPGQDALEPYRRLRTLAATLGPLQDAADGAAPHLLHDVQKRVRHVYGRIKESYATELDKLLHQLGWPKSDVVIPATLQDEWDDCVGKLLDLQRLDLLEQEESKTKQGSDKGPTILLPLEVLVLPLEMRFRYHFEGDRPTNRLEKPEYFLSHVTSLLASYNTFIVSYVQPVLLNRFRGTDLAFNAAYIDATSALITALLPMVRTKVFSSIQRAAAQPQLLSHYMHELMNFDTTIRDEWRYEGGYGIEGWKGITWEVLVQMDLFGRWLQVEKDFALARYRDIIQSPDSGELDFDSMDAGATKPTKAAIRVNDLLETITERYRPLSSFSQKLRFLIDIQISIFDSYHARLHEALEAYLTLTSTVGRSLQGTTAEEDSSLKGVGGLDRLCRVYGSADYLERAMRDWSDDVFFLELWEELQDRARNSASLGKTTAAMSVTDVAEKTSSTVGSDGEGGALFDETASAYQRLRVRAEKIIVETLNHAVSLALRPYTRINPWSTLPASGPSTSALPTTTTTAELDTTLHTLRESFTFLARAVAQAPLRRVVRQVLASLQTALWNGVLVKHTFSTAGAAQLGADVASICRVVDLAVGGGGGGGSTGSSAVAESGLRKLREGVLLLGLPFRSGGGSGGDSSEEAASGLGLWQVEKRLFADNEQARGVLEELGLEVVGEAEARSVLGRRIELGS